MGFFDDEQNNQNKSKKAPVVARADSSAAAPPKDHVGFAVQTRLLFDREVKNLVRDKFATIIRIVSNTSFGLLFGLIFLGVGKSDYVEYPEVMASFGAIANLLISTMFGVAQSSLVEFPKDRPVFLREYSTNHYSVLPYFLAKFSLECVTVMTQVPIFIHCHMVCHYRLMRLYNFDLLPYLLCSRLSAAGTVAAGCLLLSNGIQNEFLLLLDLEFHAGHGQHQHWNFHRQFV
mmetsp:Transcript_12017/g.21664  ORF Transcript_12017/g.21664 Transcript_12017/m.21664 type:complete len:232 (-) Transcript_12017:502-1197(-)